MDSYPSSTGTPVASYQDPAPPLVAITATDQTGIVFIVTALALIFSMVSMFIRLYIRLQFRQEFFRDDVTSIVAVVSGFVFAQALNSFGQTLKNVSEPRLENLQKFGYIADMFYIITLWLTKCSAAFLFIRLSPYKRHIFSSQGCILLATLFAIASLLMSGIRCDLSEPWIFINNSCTGLFWRWQTITGFDVTTELFLLAVAVYMAVGLQLPLKKKLVVVTAFSLRALVIIPAVMRLQFLSKEFSGDDPTLDGVLATVCAQIQLSYAIIATTTPCLRPFMSALNTHYGGPTETRTPTGSKHSKTARSDRDFSMGTLASPTPSNIDRIEAKMEEGIATVRDNRAGISTPQSQRTLLVGTPGDVTGDERSLQSRGSQHTMVSKKIRKKIELNIEIHQLQKAERKGSAST
ncbi:hypothetical protein GQ53DRAFT_739354 [Thozetella sp. PMI_491]|nr:hypothetical protein GQ53DRAFT_739354 [Thozetella sp. PMI_491]